MIRVMIGIIAFFSMWTNMTLRFARPLGACAVTM